MSLLPRVLVGVDGQRVDLSTHLGITGGAADLRRWSPEQLIDEIDRAGLRGHGGAAFPVARKMRAVAARSGQCVVVANGTEGEPASGKDRLLLTETPHLVLDGIAAAARAVGARTAIVAFPDGDDELTESLIEAVEERRRARLKGEPRFELVEVEHRFVAGHESALVNALSGGEAKPSFGTRPFERGVRRRPTLVQNVETLAHAALIVRNGAAWFRETGTAQDPGSALITLSGAVAAPGVYEIEHGAPLADLLDAAGLTGRLAAVLIGGYFGTWFGSAAVDRLTLAPTELVEHGGSLGAGVIVAFGEDTCPVAETARIAEYFALESAGQCGPCIHGLTAIAQTMAEIASGTAGAGAGNDLTRWTRSIAGRGACQMPDGATRFVSSALRVFAESFEDHMRHGACDRCHADPVLPVPYAVAQA